MTDEGYRECEYCGEELDDEGCPGCRADFEKQKAYWRPLWEAERGHRESVALAREHCDVPAGTDENDPEFRQAVQRLIK